MAQYTWNCQVTHYYNAMIEHIKPVILQMRTHHIISNFLNCYCNSNQWLWNIHLRAQFTLWQNMTKIMNVRDFIRKCMWHRGDTSPWLCLQGNWPISLTESRAQTKSLGTFIPPDSYARFNPWCRNWIVLLQKVAIKSWEVLPRNIALKQIEWMFPSQNGLPVCVCVCISVSRSSESE